jgi:mitogen-activated protein kinase 1/3
MTMSRRDEIASRLKHFNGGDQYDVIDIVGEGAYGVVW